MTIKKNPGADSRNSAHGSPRKLQENIRWESLFIKRIPSKTKEAFMKLAEEDFCEDFGMCLKFLVDDLINQDNRMIISKIVELDTRLSDVESLINTEEKPKTSGRKMLDGSIKNIGGNDNESNG